MIPCARWKLPETQNRPQPRGHPLRDGQALFHADTGRYILHDEQAADRRTGASLHGKAGDVIDTGAMLVDIELDPKLPQRAEAEATGHHHAPAKPATAKAAPASGAGAEAPCFDGAAARFAAQDVTSSRARAASRSRSARFIR